MVGEDFRTIANQNHDKTVALSQALEKKQTEYEQFEAKVADMFVTNISLMN